MAKSNNLLTFAATLLILLFGLNVSFAKIEEKSETSELHPRTPENINDLFKMHPRANGEQLTRTTTVDGRIQYVLGTRIAGKSSYFQLNIPVLIQIC